MKFNLTPILLTLNLLNQNQEFKDIKKVMTKQEFRALKDKLVYRLMFDKKRHDDIGDDVWGTEKWVTALKQEQK